MKRIVSIDVVRGIAMIIMALDHVRDLIHVDSINQSPTNLATTTPLLFFTRWITYLCAPIFVFLAGTSAYLSFQKKTDVAQSRAFLFKRGFWLIVLEFTLVNFGLFLDPGFHTFIFEVIAAIGFGFILLGLLLSLSPRIIGIIGLLIMFGHNLFSLLPLADGSVAKTILSPLFGMAAFPLLTQTVLVIAYPPLPWLGIMLVGFASGTFFKMPVLKRQNLFLKLGVVALLLFIVLRFINVYGDPVPWAEQKDKVYTFLSFMNVTKYPPSLAFSLVTLGFMFLLLAGAERVTGSFQKVTTVYGKVPLFYFLLHFYLIHFLLILILLLQGFGWNEMDFASGTFGRPKGVQSGLPLWSIYLIYFFVVFILYRPCKMFGRYKATHNQWWLKYI
ncbi:MAG TPA: heparan-alpha-glucosaminide N-acetyltransferase domain-containing protein [Chitinophagaceae bacterium]|nr:heparan-alpha-glucosaminide N-acetyltransferase domain-containing protein [Chitinophagaceae bacterium]